MDVVQREPGWAEADRDLDSAIIAPSAVSRLHILESETPAGEAPICLVASEARLARLAAALGAAQCGGPLSEGEQAWIAAGRQAEPIADDVVEAVRESIRAGGDPLGEMLCALRPSPRRRRHGAFYTPPTIVTAMTAWLLARAPDRVVDPGCGSGRFAAAVARLQPNIPLIAVDADPLATLLTRAALAVVGARDVRVHHHNYLTLPLPAHPGRTGFIANPPYVRHHDLSPQSKAWAMEAGQRLGIAVSGLAGLHVLFYLATALHARDGDTGCFITSAEWLDTRSGQAMRHLLAQRLGLRLLTLLDPRATPFDDAMTTAAITCFAVGDQDERVAVSVIDAPESLSLAMGDTTVERRQLAAAPRWSLLLRQGDQTPTDESTVPLRDIARVHRGVATGGNEFFVLSRERATDLGLLPWCRAAITRAEELFRAGDVVRDGPERRLLLMLPRDVDRRAHPAVDAYLRLGETARHDKPPIAQGYLARHRKPWWYLGPPSAPPIIASYMARQAPTFAYNPDGLVLLNIAHGIYPHQPLSADATQSLVRQLNAARATFRGHGRTYQGGLEKFEPREMENLPV